MNTANETTINPNYWRRYGFNRDPFNTPEQKEFFIPDSWEEYLDLLPQFARFCDTLLLIIGRPGVGKSTLINLFTNEQSADTDIFALRATDCSSAHHFLQLLNQRYGAPYDATNSAPASEQLHQQLEFLREEKASRLLIIDAAEKLPLDMRQLCLQIIQQQNALTTCLPIILVGEDSLSSQMHALLTPTTAQKCLYTIHVEPFSEDETEQYLRWCCAQGAGDKMVEFPFTPEDIASIFHQSQGVIGTINPIAQYLLSSRTKPGITLPHYLRGKVLWWCGAIITITILLIVYQQMTKPTALDQIMTQPAATPVSAKGSDAASPTPTPNAAPNSSTSNATTNSTSTTQEGASAEDLPHSDAAATPAQPTHVAPVVPVPAPTPKLATPEQTATAAPTAPVSAGSSDAASPTTVAPKQSATRLFNSSMSAELQEHQTRVLHTPPQHYTLQLIASPNLHAVQKFIVYHQLAGLAMIVPTEREGKFNYVVLYGNFPTHSIATQAQARLQKTKNIAGWMRTYKSVQELIRSGEHTPATKPVAKKSGHKKAAETVSNSDDW